MKLPLIGLGTWQLNGKECTKTVRTALKMGYRHIDTAHIYENHAAIRKGLEDFPREELFLTSKVSLDQIDDTHVEKSVEKACHLALEELGIDFLDLYLLHWPDRKRPMAQILIAMAKLIEGGLVRRIGVSNFTLRHIEDLLPLNLPLSANQVEFHPYLTQEKLLAYCQKQQIDFISYRPLGKGALLTEPLFSQIAARHGKSAGQVILRWVVQQGVPVVPKASSEEHLKENLNLFDFSLTEQEMQAISALNRGQRFCGASDPEFNY